MQRNNDGSLLLTRDDLLSLGRAYYALFDSLDGMIGFLDQFAQEEPDEYKNISNWYEVLGGREPVTAEQE